MGTLNIVMTCTENLEFNIKMGLLNIKSINIKMGFLNHQIYRLHTRGNAA